MNWDYVINSVAKKIYEETGIPVEHDSFSLERTPLQWRVLYLYEEVALIESINNIPYLEDSILDAMENIKKLSIDARMAIMNKRLDQLSDAVLKELRHKDIDADILDDIFFELEDMGHPLKHYETDKDARGYPDIALTASWDIIKVSHVLDYDTEPPLDAAAMAAEFMQEVQEYL